MGDVRHHVRKHAEVLARVVRSQREVQEQLGTVTRYIARRENYSPDLIQSDASGFHSVDSPHSVNVTITTDASESGSPRSNRRASIQEGVQVAGEDEAGNPGQDTASRMSRRVWRDLTALRARVDERKLFIVFGLIPSTTAVMCNLFALLATELKDTRWSVVSASYGIIAGSLAVAFFFNEYVNLLRTIKHIEETPISPIDNLV